MPALFLSALGAVLQPGCSRTDPKTASASEGRTCLVMAPTVKGCLGPGFCAQLPHGAGRTQGRCSR